MVAGNIWQGKVSGVLIRARTLDRRRGTLSSIMSESFPVPVLGISLADMVIRFDAVVV